jgi:hypothetical protein
MRLPDVCNGDGTCSHPVAAGNCLIGGARYAAGAANPSNQCQQCTPTISQTTWSAKTNGTACNDGNTCTKNDVCTAGTCAGTAHTCDDGLSQDGVASTSYYDSADRPVSVVKVDEKGAPCQTLIQYDQYGREAAKWRPYPSSQKGTEQSLPHLSSTYDGVGRPKQQQFASGRRRLEIKGKSTFDAGELRLIGGFCHEF